MSSVTVDPCYMPVEAEAMQRASRLAVLDHVPETLALVIPTLREAESLRELLSQVRTVLNAAGVSYEILVVDDDSQDGTAEFVSSISVEDPRVRLIVRKGERGLSGAILHGWQHSEASILGVMDADLQHPPEILPSLIAEILEGNDLAIGSRYAKGGCLGEWNPLRRLLSTTAVRVTYPLQRRFIRAKDPMSGYFLVRRRCVERVNFQRTGFKLLLEILVRGHIGSVREIPFSFGCRAAGHSKANLKVAWEYFRLLARLYGQRAQTLCLQTLRIQRQPAATQEPAGD